MPLQQVASHPDPCPPRRVRSRKAGGGPGSRGRGQGAVPPPGPGCQLLAWPLPPVSAALALGMNCRREERGSQGVTGWGCVLFYFSFGVSSEIFRKTQQSRQASRTGNGGPQAAGLQGGGWREGKAGRARGGPPGGGTAVPTETQGAKEAGQQSGGWLQRRSSTGGLGNVTSVSTLHSRGLLQPGSPGSAEPSAVASSAQG